LSISVLIGIPAFSVLRKMFGAPSLTTNQSYKLTRLPVRQPPRLAGREILDHYAAIGASGYLKWTGRERYGHDGSLMSVSGWSVQCRLLRAALPRSPFDGLQTHRRYSLIRRDIHHNRRGRRNAAVGSRLQFN
jgi:hypothetical protein